QFLTSPSIADIDGDGRPEALEGSGVYDLHALDALGNEPSGWPKFTGGWTDATPSVGDIDGDGQLEVVSVTREGLLFIWKTRGPECGPVLWRKQHHDEWNTGNYDIDARPPAAVHANGASLQSEAGGQLRLNLTAVPGDNLYCGAAVSFDVRFSPAPIVT